MKVGAEPKKVAILVGLMSVAGYLFYSNVSQPAAPPSRQSRAAQNRPANATQPTSPQETAAAAAARPAPRPQQQQQRLPSNRRILQEFKPSLLTVRAEASDPSSIDPALRVDLLEKVQSVRLQGGARNLFQFGTKPLPKVEEKIIPAVKADKEPETPKIDVADTKPAEPVKPPPVPIPLKFYGYASPAHATVKRAFFLDGDEILVAGEGELIKQRYRVIRIGINSVEMEDTHQDVKQTLRIVEQMG